MSSVIDVLKILTQRLPELEYRLGAIGQIRRSELPKGLFRTGQFEEVMSSLACMDEIRSDLARMKSLLEDVLEQTSPAALYLAKQVSLKMQVLLQLCHRAHRKNIETQTHVDIKHLVTRQEWLDNMQSEHQRLLQQYTALQNALEKNKENEHAALKLQHALDDVQAQLSSVSRMLSTLTGCVSVQ